MRLAVPDYLEGETHEPFGRFGDAGRLHGRHQADTVGLVNEVSDGENVRTDLRHRQAERQDQRADRGCDPGQ